MTNLFHFLTDLATDVKAQETFGKNSQAVMEAARLSEADKTALKSGDQATIAVVFNNELLQLAAILGDPGPDHFPDPDPPSPPPDSDSPEEETKVILQH